MKNFFPCLQDLFKTVAKTQFNFLKAAAALVFIGVRLWKVCDSLKHETCFRREAGLRF